MRGVMNSQMQSSRCLAGVLVLLTGAALSLPAAAKTDRFSVLEWSLAVEAAVESRDIRSLGNLLSYSRIEREALATDGQSDRLLMRQARQAFERGQMNRAIELYSAVPKSSDFWLESIEERGWSHLRDGRVSQALAMSRTLMVEPFVRVVGTEPFFLQSLAQLRICDYKGILKTHSSFRETQRERLLSLQSLSTRGTSPQLEAALAKVDLFPVRSVDIGEPLRHLPRLFFRDKAIASALFAMRMNSVAGQALESVRKAGLVPAQQARFSRDLSRQAQRASVSLRDRIKTLAARETQQSHRLIQKLNLIEVELVQRLQVDGQLPKESFARGEFAKTNSDQLVFPDDGRPWIDEIDKYEVRLNACPSNVRRRM